MDRWVGRVAIVTGASSGIGEAVAKDLARHGMKVAAVARRIERLQKHEEECKGFKGSLKGYKCYVTNEEEIARTVAAVVKDLGPISVLINNAGVVEFVFLTDTSTGSCRKMYETNVIGPVTFAQNVIESMQKHKINDGHIININSIVGHTIIPVKGVANYCASKNAVTVLTESMKNELAVLKMKTKVTSLSPGLVRTEMTQKFLKEEKPSLSAAEISESIIYVLSTNPNVNISELTIQPVGEAMINMTK